MSPTQGASELLPEAERWRIVQRFQEYQGELSANVLRAFGVLAFYVVELVNFHGLSLGPVALAPVEGVDRQVHLAITALAVAWVALAGGVLLLLRAKVFPAGLKFGTTAADVVLLTCMLVVVDGPKSTLSIGYFLVITLAVLRFSPRLVGFATAGAIAGYSFVVGNALLFRPTLKLLPYQEFMFVLALLLVGVILSRATRQAHRAAAHLVAFSAPVEPS